MKKLSVLLSTILAVAIVAISFTSCEEPEEPDVPDVPEYSGAGVYNPAKKVSKVYMSIDDEPEFLASEWKWNGNNLTSITYFEEGVVVAKEVFTYDNNRLIKVTDAEGNYSEYFYTDDQYAKVKSYDSTGHTTMDIIFQYEGDKVTSLTINKFGPAKNAKNMIERGFIGQLLPGKVREIVAKKLTNSPEQPDVITLTYDGDNLSSMTMGSVVSSYSEYDTYSNYSFSFYPISASAASIYAQALSKNNMGRTEVQYGALNIVATYTYTYIDNFPATVRTEVTLMGENTVLVQRIEYK